MARKVQEINAGSMADIAFLLLIFFLVTTTMDVDSGIMRVLPPPVQDDQIEEIDVKKRNVFTVLINSSDQLFVNGKPGNLKDLRRDAKDFLTPRPQMADNNNYAEVKEAVEYEHLGTFRSSKGVISMQNDRGTSYQMYVSVQNELAAAVRELRDEICKQKFNMTFEELLETNEDIAKDIQKAIPVAISEAEPVNYGEE
jgi:biopolymer transport protein ExbD